jgi:hypothetical protein
MLFRVCEHYSDDHQNIQDQNNVCFICFEYEIDNEKNPINLRKHHLYLNSCICDGAVHKFCLKTWFYIHKSCPICRIKVIEYNNTTLIIYNFIPFGIKIYTFITFITSNTIRFISTMISILFLCILIDFYLILFITKYNNQYDDYNYILDEYGVLIH